jgi:hypothetical protein
METSRSPSPGALQIDAAAQAGLLSIPSSTTSMTEADYTQLVSALSTAAGLLSNRRGELNAADLRIRSLVSIAEKEAKRALLVTRSGQRAEAESQPGVA